MASIKTLNGYRAKGMVFARQARQRYPDWDPLEALCRHAEARTDILTRSTVRLYRRQYCSAAIAMGRESGRTNDDIVIAMRRLTDALQKLAGRPPVPRTASKKVKDAKDWWVKEIFGHLKLMAVRHHRIRSAACGLYCLLVPKLGTRPVELVGAYVEGDHLFVPSAKQPGNRQVFRSIDISGFHPTHREALLALIHIVARDVEAGGYRQWLKRLAEILARACETVSKETGQHIPRLSPSAFRHTAISTWHAAGYTPEEIAELVGHRDLRSQNAYKRAGSAWPIDTTMGKPSRASTGPDIGAAEKAAVPLAARLVVRTENPADEEPDSIEVIRTGR